MDTAAMAVWQQANAGGGHCDSLSCLHVLEHLGLGRYGDRIDPNGYKTGFANLAGLLRPGGRFYLSTPIGQERVEFNANWVCHPATILRLADSQGLQLERWLVFNPRTGLRDIAEDGQNEALPHSHPNAKTWASSSLCDPWSAQGNRDRHSFRPAPPGRWKATLAEPVSKQPAHRYQAGVLL